MYSPPQSRLHTCHATLVVVSLLSSQQRCSTHLLLQSMQRFDLQTAASSVISLCFLSVTVFLIPIDSNSTDHHDMPVPYPFLCCCATRDTHKQTHLVPLKCSCHSPPTVSLASLSLTSQLWQLQPLTCSLIASAAAHSGSRRRSGPSHLASSARCRRCREEAAGRRSTSSSVKTLFVSVSLRSGSRAACLGEREREEAAFSLSQFVPQ